MTIARGDRDQIDHFELERLADDGCPLGDDNSYDAPNAEPSSEQGGSSQSHRPDLMTATRAHRSH
jgi:hypothetical protein